MKNEGLRITKLLALLIIWIGICTCSYAQKNDYIWLAGGASNWHNPNTIDSTSGNVKLDFNYNPVQIKFDSINLNFWETDVSFSDSNGKLLFYSNGVSVYNGLNEMMENGDSLNAGYIEDVWDTIEQIQGFPFNQGILALPDAANPNQYYLIHSYNDSIPGSGGFPNYMKSTLNTLIDMSANGGEGRVVYKNRPIISDSLGGLNESITATKHGNGRDWWLIAQKHTTNCFLSILLDQTGFRIMDSVCAGPVAPQLEDADYSCFSPDGSKFVYLSYYNGLNIFDFDRCTGALSNPRQIYLNELDDSLTTYYGYAVIMGIAISPNSRFLYLSLDHHVYQLDLWSDDIYGHIDTVAAYDGWYWYAPLIGSYFGNCQLGPDGRIYISCNSNIPYYHVINNPDDSGAACNLVQRGVPLPVTEQGLPNYPNYRLGALTGSACDTLTGLNELQRAAKEQIINVYPNPAADYAIIDYGFTDWSKGGVYLELCNTLGQTVYTQALPMYSGLQKIDVSSFASGMYMIFIKRRGAVIATNKLVKQ